MFTSSNSLSGLLSYFKRKLSENYEEREIENIFYLICYYQFGLSKIMVAVEDRKLTESELLKIREYVHRLQNNEPIQYILGETEFYGLKISVNPSVLIPRPETEELIELILKQTKVSGRVLDIGAGSGCIPIALKKNRPGFDVFATDISDKALELAKENAVINNVNVEFIKSDILEDDLNSIPILDLIVSNPPYIPLSDKNEMEARVLEFEPDIALFVPDNDPLIFYKRIGQIGRQKLNEGGKLFFEIHEGLGNEVRGLLEGLDYHQVTIHKDLQGKDRMVSAVK